MRSSETGFFFFHTAMKTQWFSSDWGSYRNLHTLNSTHMYPRRQKILFPLLSPTALHKGTQAGELPSQAAPCSLQLSGKALHRAPGHASTFPFSHGSAGDTLLPALQSQSDLCPLCLPPSRWHLANSRGVLCCLSFIGITTKSANRASRRQLTVPMEVRGTGTKH